MLIQEHVVHGEITLTYTLYMHYCLSLGSVQFNVFGRSLILTKTGFWKKKKKNRLHFISIVTLDVLIIIGNLSTTCQLTVIRVLVYYSRLSVNC